MDEVDKVHRLTRAVFRHLEQVHNSNEARAPRELGCDAPKADLGDARHVDRARAEPIAPSDFQAQPLPTRTLQVISPFMTGSRSRLLNTINVSPYGAVSKSGMRQGGSAAP